MSKKVTSGTIVWAIVILVGVGYYISTHGDESASDSSAAERQAASTAVIDPVALAARVGTIDHVSTAVAPKNASDPYFTVTIKEDSAFAAGETVQKILHSIHNHVGTSAYAGVRVNLIVGLVDRYGRKSEEPMLQLTYAANDISKIVFENVTTFDVLNLASVASLNPASSRILGGECQPGNDLAKYADDFCRAVTSL